MIYNSRPKDFKTKFEVSSCFVEYDGKILLLYRQDHKPEGNTWCMPGGKIDDKEEPNSASIREVGEETGLITLKNEFKYLGKVYVRYPNYDFIYHLFQLKLDQEEKIKIDLNEHKDFRWVSVEEALKMPLIQDLDRCIKMCYKL